jgi:membrane associated rhomboid family serine protease
MMEADDSFQSHLDTRADNPVSLLPADSPEFDDWRALRQTYVQRKPATFTHRWALKHGESFTNVSWTWLTAAFLHGSVGHLMGNMVFLFLFGFSVEMALGRLRYLGFYLLGALGSSLLCIPAYANSMGYGLGASGAISCVMVLYALLFKKRSIQFFYIVFFYFNYVRAPALILVPLWILNELVSWAFVHANVGYAAHLGGMLTGLALAHWMPAQGEMDKALHPPLASPPNVADLVAQAQALVGKMQWLPACAAWNNALTLSPQDHTILRRYFNTARHARDATQLRLSALAILSCRSSQSVVVELQQECWRWCQKNAPTILAEQEPLLVTMVQRWAMHGSHADTDALLKKLQEGLGKQALWLDTVERYVTVMVKNGQAAACAPWLPVLEQARPQAAIVEPTRQTISATTKAPLA